MPDRSINPESQKIEYKSSWQEDYFAWICGYANAKGGVLYIGVNDDGYVVGVKDTRYLLDTLPNQISSFLGISVSIDHSVTKRGGNIKYETIPSEVVQKPENLYAAGLLTKEILTEIDSEPNNTKDVSESLQELYNAAPAFVKQLRKNEGFRKKVIVNVETWMAETPVIETTDGSLEYVWITVDELPYGVSYHGHYYIRSGGTTTELKGISLSRFLLDRIGKKWDGMPVKSVSISHEALEYLRENAVIKGRLSEKEASVSDQMLLKNLNMLTEDGEYTRAAAMLFADPEKVMVGSHIMIGYFAPAGTRGKNKSTEVIYHDEVRGPLILQAEKAVDLLYSKYMKALIDYEGIRRVETFMIPEKAMREILLNALSHKNYASGNPIQIKVYDDHITVMNEGFWPFDDLKVEDVYDGEHSSYRENPLIATGFYRAGEIETWGQGFGKIKDACEAAGVPLPTVKATPRSITVEIRPSERYLRLLNRNETDDGKNTKSQTDLSFENQKTNDKKQTIKTNDKKQTKKTAENVKNIIAFLEANGESKTAEIAEGIGLSADRTRVILANMEEVVSIGANRNRTYKLK